MSKNTAHLKDELIPYSGVSNNVRITVYPQFLALESSPADGIYSHAYTVIIENLRTDTVQLLERHWLVVSGGALLTEVRGEGVVGEQPILKPGERFQYTSGSVINDPVGSMDGKYFFASETGESFTVDIPRFDLMYPELVH